MEMNPKILLLVEDDPALAQPLSGQLEKEGFQVLKAQNGEEGLESAKQHHPDLILLDIVMPKMNGLTMLEKLREDEWGKGAQVIMLTNFSDLGNVSQALRNDVTDYIVKSDWSLDQVISKVKVKLAMK